MNNGALVKLVDVHKVYRTGEMEVPAVRLHTLEGFETSIFPYTTDVPMLSGWGTPLLFGPGSIHVAHTDEEHIAVDELHAAVGVYESLMKQLLAA